MYDVQFPAAAPVPRRQWLRLSLGTGLALAGLPFAAEALGAQPTGLVWRERLLQALGTQLQLRAGHASGAQADAGLDAAVAAIQHVERQMSLFDPHSAVSRLNREGVLHHPHPDLVAILGLAQSVSAKSQGAFDVTVQPFWNAWASAQKAGRVATASELALAKARVGWRNLDVSTDKISFKRPGMGITLNGIAQGFAGDLAQAALQAHGIEHALLDTGEWTALGQSPDGSPWRLGVANPRPLQQMIATLALGGKPGQRALATSSDAHCRFGASDLNHHIFNPKTGYSPRQLASVTVLASTGAMADALTKVMLMGSLDDALRLARLWQVEVLAVAKNGHFLASNKIFSARST